MKRVTGDVYLASGLFEPLWIHPGYLPARQDLEALAAFHDSSVVPGDAGEPTPSGFEMIDPDRR